ncbi:ribonuclease R [Brotaphodocola catenula]|uniref:Ribonuclease R n=1 Tax=Brotaphodocola catenula TaxID=2885361 RepID=A0AAE3AMC2_9FIRM|nr:ribonuclease R [Brotaphodocola catenula]MCC2164413.1 ribonuclease R [Brotaphodocola catenula]
MTEELLNQRKETMLALLNDPTYVPMKLKELAMLLNLSRDQRDELREVMESLEQDGKVILTKRGKYKIPSAEFLTGTFSGTAKGFGFVTVEGRPDDIYIPYDKVKDAMHGDRVQIVAEPARGGRRAEGTVVKVLERANQTLVGYYQKSKNFGFVIPDNQKIGEDVFIPQGKDMGAVTGHKVIVKLTDYGGERKKPEGEIVEIIGHVNDPGTDILSIVKAYGIPDEYPQEVMEQIEHIPDEVQEAEKVGRKDIRDWQTVTIDGEDAKDLDDAITISREDFGYRLGVHIADVSHYVREGSPLDREALKRGTSVYLVDRVVPMLPHKLSNGICSLNQGVDRLALSCIMDIDPHGKVLSHEVAETLIRVDRRMTYTAVNAIITDRDPAVMAEYDGFVEMFDCMKELADILRDKRSQRGSIDFDFPETKILLDEKGHPTEIKPYERNSATKIIEDFMLMANETIAEDYYWQEIPFLYRTHDNPDPEKMKRLGIFINNFGYSLHLQNGEVHPKEIQKLLTKIEGTEEEALISRLTLRSMKQAKYMPISGGHFGLAARYYTHFTSPIRRYPDLQIHRIIKENLHGNLTGKRISHYDSILTEVSIQCSQTERRADEAEREVVKMKKCEYMSKRVGQIYEGVISGVTNWGFYVELPNTVEGLVRVSDLYGDYYLFSEEKMELRGERSGRIYRLGQKVKVTVSGTDKLTRTVDFLPYFE